MSEKAVLSGSLSFVSLPDIFQILGGNNSTGVLRLTSRFTPNPGLIYFVNGDATNATNSSLKGLKAIYAMFGWLEGRFEFLEEDVKIDRVIKNSRMEIVLDALRMLDDGDVKRVGAPSFDGAAAKKDGAKPGEKNAAPFIKGPLVDYAHIVAEDAFTDEQRIVNEGGHGKWIWVILQGTVKVTKKMPDGDLLLSQLGEGSFIGSFKALTFQENVRRATVTAVGEVQLGLLDTERLAIEYAALSPQFRALLFSLDARLEKTTARAAGLSMKEDTLRGLIKDKKVFTKKGSSKEEAFVIREGNAYVVGKSQKGNLPLLTLERDDVFGYLPFMDMGHEPRSAAVLASEDLKVDKLDTESLQREYEGLSGTFRNMIYNVGSFIFITTKKVYDIHEGK